MIKLNPNGDIVWAKTYGGTKDDSATAVAIAPDGDIFVVGYTKSFGAGNADAWVLRLNEKGDIKWQRTYGGQNDDVANAVAIAPNGDVITAGYTFSFSTGWKNVWVLRLDQNGNVKWQRVYGAGYSKKTITLVIDSNLNGDITITSSTSSFGSGGTDV